MRRTRYEDLHGVELGLFDAPCIVRHWDGMDGTWTDVTDACSPAEALAEWYRRTGGGTTKISFDEIDYYRIFPADTVMEWSNGKEMFRPEG